MPGIMLGAVNMVPGKAQSLSFCRLKLKCGDFPVAQWLRICLPMQGTQV